MNSASEAAGFFPRDEGTVGQTGNERRSLKAHVRLQVGRNLRFTPWLSVRTSFPCQAAAMEVLKCWVKTSATLNTLHQLETQAASDSNLFQLLLLNERKEVWAGEEVCLRGARTPKTTSFSSCTDCTRFASKTEPHIWFKRAKSGLLGSLPAYVTRKTLLARNIPLD